MKKRAPKQGEWTYELKIVRGGRRRRQVVVGPNSCTWEKARMLLGDFALPSTIDYIGPERNRP